MADIIYPIDWDDSKAEPSTNKANTQTASLSGGITITAPMVALAYSYAVLQFRGSSSNNGQTIAVTCNGNTINITLNHYGNADVSLVPFIRKALQSASVQNEPLASPHNVAYGANKYRGSLSVSIVGASSITMVIYYIFGNYAMQGKTKRDIYLDYHPDGETWCNADLASHYDSVGRPGADFANNWANANFIVGSTPTRDFDMPLDVAWFYGNYDVRFRRFTYHFRYDCRVANIMRVRWLDQNGNINVRKFVVGGRSHGGASGDAWQRPHTYKNFVAHSYNSYDRGKDQWANITANETITLGDDAIPMTHFDWLKTLTSSAAVEVFKGNAWVRVNFGDASVECDPRKQTFSMSLTLILPTDDVQQF